MGKLITIFKASLSSSIAERESVLVWSLYSALTLIPILIIWLVSEKTNIGGYSKNQLLTYYFLIFFIEQFLDWAVFWDLSEFIRDGTISNYLLKPYKMIQFLFIHESAYRLINLFTNMLIGSILFFILKDKLEISISIETLILLIPVICIGIGIVFLTDFIFGCITFFTQESNFIHEANWIIGSLFSGKAIPIAFFPAVVLQFIQFNPFRFTFSFPLEILFNQIDKSEYLLGLCVGFVWVILFALISIAVWRKGLKHYSAYGS